jgi:hypothetical protein
MPQKMIETKFEKKLTLLEMVEYDAIIVEMLDTAPQPVHVLADVTSLEYFPSLGNARQIKSIHHPNFGWCVLVGNKNPIMKAVTLLVGTLFGNRIQWLATREEAFAFLQRMDNTLIELK